MIMIIMHTTFVHRWKIAHSESIRSASKGQQVFNGQFTSLNISYEIYYKPRYSLISTFSNSLFQF